MCRFVHEEWSGVLDYEGAKIIGARIGKKPRSIVTKSRMLGLRYRPMHVRLEDLPRDPGDSALPPRAVPKTIDPYQELNLAQLQMPNTNAEPDIDPSALSDSLSEATQMSEREWDNAVAHLEATWTDIGLKRFWSQQFADFRRRLQQQQHAIDNTALFTDADIAAKKERWIKSLEARFFSTMVRKLKPSLFSRLLNPVRNFEQLEARYASNDRGLEYRIALDDLKREQLKTQNKTVDELFTIEERQERLTGLTNHERDQFLHAQESMLNVYRDFRGMVESLPDDDLDAELATMETEFKNVGRSREWFMEFDALVNESVDLQSSDNSNTGIGQNEPAVRILQSDLLATLGGRLKVYQKFHRLRTYTHEQNIAHLIRDISFFETYLADAHYGHANAAQIADMFSAFIDSLEKKVKAHQLQQIRAARKAQKRRKVQRIAQDQRMAQWSRFKQKFITDKDLDNVGHVVPAFNQLRKILRLSPEWTTATNRFRDGLLQSRLLPSHDKRREMKETAHFVNQMVSRVDDELATDIAFQSLQETLKEKEVLLPELNLVLEQLKQDAAGDNLDGAHLLKIEFLEYATNALPDKVTSLHEWKVAHS
ncbi:MAG: hypothetical protein AAF525_05780 [Pseudomonadota bacterium]